jgi:hypothetical protein
MAEEHRQIGGWWGNIKMVKNISRMAAMIGGVVYDVQKNVPARHATNAASNELKLNGLRQFSIRY